MPVDFCRSLVGKTPEISPFNSTRYVVLYPQNGDRIMTIDSVTSLNCVYVCIYLNQTTRVHRTYEHRTCKSPREK